MVEGRAAIVDAAHAGEPGELWLRGPTVMKVGTRLPCGLRSCGSDGVRRVWGYLHNPTAIEGTVSGIECEEAETERIRDGSHQILRLSMDQAS